MESPDVYRYLDYRQYCRDFYQLNKTQNPRFSYRFFARRADVAGSYLKHVMDGKRNLSSEMSIKFAKGMGLDQKQVEYFENLVRFNQAGSVDEKTLYFDRLRQKRAKALRSLGLAEAAGLLSNWYVVAIKELAVNLNTIDPKTIQNVLRKRLPESVIERTLGYLQEMGWLDQKDGHWVSSMARIQFPDEVKSYVIQSFHSQMLQVASEALEDGLEEREFRASTFTIPKDRVPELKERIKSLHHDLIAFVQDVNQSEEKQESLVYHFGVQCFSLQKNLEDEK